MRKRNSLGFGGAIGVGLLVGFSLPILLFWWFIYNLRKSAELVRTGTRVTATVTRILTHNVQSFIFSLEDYTFERKVPKQVYHLVAQWKNPQTGKTYTLRSPVKNAEKFPVGSSVFFLIDPQHPRRHLLDTRKMDILKE